MGIEPNEEKIFDHKIEGGGLELIETINEKPINDNLEQKEKIKINKNKIKEMK
jgi:hypothetical protein